MESTFFPLGFRVVFNTFAGMDDELLTLLPEDLETRVLHAYLLSAVGPRPIAFASTVDGTLSMHECQLTAHLKRLCGGQFWPGRSF